MIDTSLAWCSAFSEETLEHAQKAETMEIWLTIDQLKSEKWLNSEAHAQMIAESTLTLSRLHDNPVLRDNKVYVYKWNENWRTDSSCKKKSSTLRAEGTMDQESFDEAKVAMNEHNLGSAMTTASSKRAPKPKMRSKEELELSEAKKKVNRASSQALARASSLVMKISNNIKPAKMKVIYEKLDKKSWASEMKATLQQASDRVRSECETLHKVWGEESLQLKGGEGVNILGLDNATETLMELYAKLESNELADAKKMTS